MKKLLSTCLFCLATLIILLGQGRLDIYEGIQVCTHNNVPVRFGGIPVQGCFMISDAIGQQVFTSQSQFITSDTLVTAYVRVSDNTDTLLRITTYLGPGGGGGVSDNIYTSSDSIDDNSRYVKMDVTTNIGWTQQLFLGRYLQSSGRSSADI